MAVDVAVMSPLAPTYERRKEPCEWYATQKHEKCDESFVDTNYFFCAMVFENLGGVNAEGRKCSACCFGSQPNVWVASLLLIVGELGLDYLAIFNTQSHICN